VIVRLTEGETGLFADVQGKFFGRCAAGAARVALCLKSSVAPAQAIASYQYRQRPLTLLSGASSF
jgi:hypothetical protein